MATSEVTGKTIMWRHWHVLVLQRYSTVWMERYYRLALPVSGLLFVVSITANTLAGVYATARASNSVTDIILSNIPVFDVDLIYVYGAIVLMVAIALLLLARPRRMPFVLCSLSIFFLIRAVFISITHVAIYPDHAVLDFQSKIILTLFGGDQQFFSGHTGVPFLMALLYWRDHFWRYAFLACSVFLGTVVLLGHLHYSVDVLSAFFITYTIYHIALYLFPREYSLFVADEELGAISSAEGIIEATVS